MDNQIFKSILADCLENGITNLHVEKEPDYSPTLRGTGDGKVIIFVSDLGDREKLEELCGGLNEELRKRRRTDPIQLQVEDFIWERDPYYPHRLHARLCVGGVDFHAEAIEVTSEDSAYAVDSGLQNRISGVELFDGKAPKGYNTMTIGGRPHFVIMFPYQN